MALIAQQRIGEIVLGVKLFLFGRGVGADANNLDARLFKLLEFITESLAFDDSARRVGFGKKPDHQLAALQV